MSECGAVALPWTCRSAEDVMSLGETEVVSEGGRE